MSLFPRSAVARAAVLAATALAALTVATACATPAATPPAGSATTGSGPATLAPPTTTAPASGCPVDAATLETAFQANAGLAGAIVLGNGFKDITCYQNFAVARATPTNVDPALVLFAYDVAGSTWNAVTGGTAVRCSEHGVPADVVPHLPGCAE